MQMTVINHFNMSHFLRAILIASAIGAAIVITFLIKPQFEHKRE